MSNAILLCGPIRLLPLIRGAENAGKIPIVRAAVYNNNIINKLLKFTNSEIMNSIWPLNIAIIRTKIITPIDHRSTRGDRYDP